MPRTEPNPILLSLRQEFRLHLEQFYSSLNLAPPYHSMEKALHHLSSSFKKKIADEQKVLAEDSRLKRKFYGQVFVESGLSKKHRGIIQGLVESGLSPELTTQYQHFITAFHSQSQHSKP